MLSWQAKGLAVLVAACLLVASFARTDSPAGAVEIPPSVREFIGNILERIPKTTIRKAVGGGEVPRIVDVVPRSSGAWSSAWRSAVFREAALDSASSVGAEARGQLGRWFRFSDEQIETFAARKLRKMLCVARLESARLPGRQYVREQWVRQQLQGLGLPMSEASSNGLASWLTTKINDSDPQATLACTAWAYLAGR